MFVWPNLTLWAFGVFFGGWLVVTGLQLVTGSMARVKDHSPTPATLKLRSFGKIAGSALASVLAVSMMLVTSFIHAGDPTLVLDSFCTPPTDLPAVPGQLLRVGELTEGIPENPRGTPLPVVSLAHGTKGIIPRCAPSLSALPYADGPAAALRELVSQGRAGVMTDYVGLGTAGPHPYLVGQAEARNVLDAFRAAQQLEEFTLRNDTLIWGHSQGGHGALWSAAIAKNYAPEIKILGVTALAPATNLVELALGVKDEAAGKVVSSSIAKAWDEVFPELNVSSLITPGYAKSIQRIGELCFDGRDALAVVIGSTQRLDAVIPESALNGPLGEELRENSVNENIDYPLFVAQGDGRPAGAARDAARLGRRALCCRAGDGVSRIRGPGAHASGGR